MKAVAYRARRIVKTLVVTAFMAASCSSVWAQCAMCRAAVGNSAEAASMASGMNLAVMVLLIPPLALFCAFFVAAYRFRKAPGEAHASDLEKEAIAHREGLIEEEKAGRDGLRAGGDGPTALLKAN